jgi:UDP-N-acetylmuramoyl-L-alanyl-D-glutamate--2,6-diaminopimelate ligase
MVLGDLIPKTAGLTPESAQIPIAGLTADSRAVREGFLFAALPGTAMDGAKFIPQAFEQGAAAVLTHTDWQAAVDETVQQDLEGRKVIACAEPRLALALAAARFYEGQPETICAVTGTNGKTSIVSFVRQIWQRLGRASASLGGLGVISPNGHVPLHHTTPDPVEIHKNLKALADEGVTHLAMEASSHGLAQHRLDGVKVTAAAFTNLTRDHLEYHDGFEDYLYAKMRLFGELLAPGSVAVLNADMDVVAEVEELCWARGLRVFSIGEKGNSVKILSQKTLPHGQELEFEWRGTAFKIDLPLVGAFQASNALIAAALVVETGEALDAVVACLEHLEGAPGRMELAGATPSGAAVYIDYAHTPDALETILRALRPHTSGRLSVVVGCGGDRDKGKRPLMGGIAAEFADTAIITDDNPRGEDAGTIREEVMAGVGSGRSRVQEIGDRGKAIETALSQLMSGDILVVAGKGHESGQIVGDEVLPFNDKDYVQACLKEMGGRS